MNCKICYKANKYIFSAQILNKYTIDYYYCNHCGFLQTEEPYWLDEVYNEPINIYDTGYLRRNLTFSRTLPILLTMFFNKDGKFLDYAGGYGVFVRLMRDVGLDFYWDDKYTDNLFAKGFQYNGQDIEAITTFESFEHFSEPEKEIENMLKISKNIIFSTELLPQVIPKPTEWWYYGLNHGQHISFYSEKTLNFIAKKYGLNYYTCEGLHLLTEKKISTFAILPNISFGIDFTRKLSHFIDFLGNLNEQYIIYGYGTVGKTIYKLIPNKIIAFVDQTSNLITKSIIKGKVYSPENLCNMQYDKIIISVLGREKKILDYLINELKISRKKIVLLEIA